MEDHKEFLKTLTPKSIVSFSSLKNQAREQGYSISELIISWMDIYKKSGCLIELKTRKDKGYPAKQKHYYSTEFYVKSNTL